MTRQDVHPHVLLAPRAPRSAGHVRRGAAFGVGPLLAVPVAIAAALAGLVFLLLLPLCGIASVAQAAAAAGWAFAKRVARPPTRGGAED